MEKLKIEYLDIEKLIPYINNPRKNKNAVDKVAASIKEFGFKVPIIIDKENVIVAGHTRLSASRKLGIKEVPVIRVEDLTEQQVKAFRIADNKTSEFAEWDEIKLNAELQEIEIDMSLFGVEEIEQATKELKKIELTPYNKIHWLISADVNDAVIIINKLDELKDIRGIEIESTLN